MTWYTRRSLCLTGLLLACLPLAAHAQTYSRTETIVYEDNLPKWVIGQEKKRTCNSSVPAPADSTSCNGSANSVMSETSYDPTWAVPTVSRQFNKIFQTLAWDTAATVASGQRGTVKTVADGNGNMITPSNWKRGIPQSIKYPATPEATSGATQTAVVDNNGWLTSVTDEAGSRTCYAYDAMGRITSITHPSEAAANTCNTSTWAVTTAGFAKSAGAKYGLPAGHWQHTVATGVGRKIVYLDALWRPVVTETFDNTSATTANATRSVIVTRYDVAGRQAFQSYPMASLSNYAATTLTGSHATYDVLNRPLQAKQDWEGTGQLTTTTQYLDGFRIEVTNPRNQKTTTNHMAWDQPITDFPVQITHPAGAFTHITRDPYGKPTRIRRSNNASPTAGTGIDRTYTYSANQELCRTVEPETGATVMGYDGAGNLIWSAAGLPAATGCNDTATINPRKVSRTYDARHRLKTLAFPDNRGNQTWTYTPDGLPASITTGNDASGAQQATNSYSYNRRRLLTREILQFGTVLTWPVDYVYNGIGHLASLTWHGLAVNYAPNALGQPTQAGTYATGVMYHPNGGIKEFTYGNGIKHTLTQNARGLPDTSCDFYGTCAAGAILNDGYDYDQHGNVAAISDGRTGNRGNRTMTYDGLDRLTQSVSPMFGTATYAYDVLDNLTRVKLTGGNQVRDHYYCYDATWRLTNVKTGSCSGATVIGLGYDVQGNLANKSGRTYAFDYGNRLRSNSGSPGSSYAYDGHGRRVLDQVGTGPKYSHYLQDGRLSMTGDNRAGKVAEYVYLQGSLVAIRERDVPTNVYTTKYQHTDALGSPVAITDQSRTVLERTEYEPYGRPANRIARDGPGYTGHVEDAATSLTYMQQRYYDPQIGLFLSVDPVAASSNPAGQFHRYRYANNNPYKFIDPDGRQALKNRSQGCGQKIYCGPDTRYLGLPNGEPPSGPFEPSTTRGELNFDGYVVRNPAVRENLQRLRTAMDAEGNKGTSLNVTGGESYQAADGRVRSVTNDSVISNRRSNSAHNIENGARGVDLRATTMEHKKFMQIVRAATDFTNNTNAYEDRHEHLGLPNTTENWCPAGVCAPPPVE